MRKKLFIVGIFLVIIVVCGFFLLNRTNIAKANGNIFRGKATSEKPNIVLIVIDTLRTDHLGCYGYSRDTTPSIDRLAAESLRFTNMISSSSWTMPSHVSILTGLYPSVHKTTDYGKKIDEQIVTLAEVLQKNGYYTAGFISNPTLEAKYGFAQGFDFYDDFTVDMDLGFNLFEDQDVEAQSVALARTSPPLNKATLSWLKTNYDKRFFLFLHYFDPHYDYVPPPPYDTLFDPDYKGNVDGTHIIIGAQSKSISKRDLKHIIALYDGEIRYTDEHIGQLLKEIENLGIKEKTLIIIVGDHGDEFAEHGGFGHGTTLYNELIHVPLMIKRPAISEPITIDSLVSDVDIMPTICDYLKISVPDGVQGKSLLPLIKGEKKEVHSVVYSELSIPNHPEVNPTLKAVISKEFKFIYNYDRGTREIYRVRADSGEKKNILNSKPEQAKLMEKELMNFVEVSNDLAVTLRSSNGDKTVEMDEKTREKLRSLGYMQ